MAAAEVTNRSLGSLDSRVRQKRWRLSDHRMWWQPNEDQELDQAEHEVGIEDPPPYPGQGW
jgi:hypothetical protein